MVQYDPLWIFRYPDQLHLANTVGHNLRRFSYTGILYFWQTLPAKDVIPYRVLGAVDTIL